MVFVVVILVMLGLVASVVGDPAKFVPPRQQRYPVALITAVDAYGPAARAGMVVGDRIVSVNDTRIMSLDDLNRALRDAGSTARITYIRVETERTIAVDVYPEYGKIGIEATMIEMYPYYPIYLAEKPRT
jgi:membrane-associated protease RseP (regulator of RpoE activity)